nr:glutamate receptor ionotropic, kainate 2-like [Ciona intestinalis]|eukprot:XP_018667856.2 glutamate receptor ionotropic, kainate 2-like [Ciona intestinalis]
MIPKPLPMFFLCLLLGQASSKIIIQTAVIYDDYYADSLPSFRKAIADTNLHVLHTEFYQNNMTNIVETITAEKVSSLFILAKFINCTAMVELKQAVTVFFIGMVRQHCEPGDNFLMYMYPSHFDVMGAMYDAIEQYRWKTAAVFYDESRELAFGYQDLDLARQRGINFKVWVIPEDQDKMWGILKSVRLLGYRTYILACDYKIATSVLTKAVFLSMVSEVNHWMLPSIEMHPLLLQDFLESSVRLTVISAKIIRDVLERNYVYENSERHARDEVITAITTDAFNRIRRSCDEAIAIGCFDIPLSEDSQCGIDQGAKSFSLGSYYSVGTCTEMYMRGLKEIGPTRIEFLEHHLENEKGTMSLQGYWKDKSFEPGYIPFVQAAVVFPEDPLKVGIVYELPWVKWHVNELTSETTYEGFLIDLLETLSRRLNFKYELYWNEKVGPNRGNEKEVDAEVNRLLETKQVEFVLYTRPILGGKLGKEELSIAFQQVSYYMVTLASGNDVPVNIWQFLAPFTFDSWFVLWASLIVVSIFLAVVNHFNPFEWRKMALDDTNDDVGVEEFNRLGFGNSIWMAYGGLVHQGVDIEPRSYAGRMITGTWWYFTMLVIAAYTANLTAFLTQEFSEEVASLSELLDQPHYDYGTTADAHIMTYFLPHAETHPFTTVWQHLKTNPANVFNTTAEIFERISQGGFYYLAPFREVAKAEQQDCLYSRVGEGFWDYQYALPFQISSRYTAVFSDAIASLRDDGTLHELESKWFNFRTECTESSFDIESNRLGIGNLGGMFILLVIGSFLSLMVHYGEVLWSRRRKLKYFRNKSEKKETKDDLVTEMRKKREQEKKELNQQLEEWEGGYDYWVNRMDRINKTLETIDEQTKHHKRKITGRSESDSEDEDNQDFNWWTGAYQNMTQAISGRAHKEAELQRDTVLAENPDETDIQTEDDVTISGLDNFSSICPPEFQDAPDPQTETETKSTPMTSPAADVTVTSPAVEERRQQLGRLGRMLSFKEGRKNYDQWD